MVRMILACIACSVQLEEAADDTAELVSPCGEEVSLAASVWKVAGTDSSCRTSAPEKRSSEASSDETPTVIDGAELSTGSKLAARALPTTTKGAALIASARPNRTAF